MPTFPSQIPASSVPSSAQVVSDLSFLLEANWNGEVTLASSFATGIGTARDGTEQRISMRKYPVREVSYSLNLLGDDDTSRAKWQVLRGGSCRSLVPLPQDQAEVATPATAGATVITLKDASDRLLQPGGQVALLRREPGAVNSQFEQAEVVSVVGNVLTVALPIANDLPAGSVVMPLMLAEVSSGSSGGFISSQTGSLDVTAVEVSQENIYASDATDYFPDGEASMGAYAIFPEITNYDGSGGWATARDLEENSVGNSVEVIARGTRPTSRFTLNFLSVSRAESRRLSRFFESMKGMGLPFFLVSPIQEFDAPLATLAASDITGITCEANFPSSDWAYRPYIGIAFTDGSTAIASAGSVSVSGGRHIVPFDTAIPLNGRAICRITRGYYVRFDTDKLEESWVTDGVSSTSLTFRELEEEPTMPTGPLRVAKCSDPGTTLTPSFNLTVHMMRHGLLAYGENPIGDGVLIHEDDAPYFVEAAPAYGTDEVSVRARNPGACSLDGSLDADFELTMGAGDVGQAEFDITIQPPDPDDASTDKTYTLNYEITITPGV